MHISKSRLEDFKMLILLAGVYLSIWIFSHFGLIEAIVLHLIGGVIGVSGMIKSDPVFPKKPIIHLPLAVSLGWIAVGWATAHALDRFKGVN